MVKIVAGYFHEIVEEKINDLLAANPGSEVIHFSVIKQSESTVRYTAVIKIKF